MSEPGDSLNLCCGRGKSSENSSDVSTILHRDNSELILFIYPNKESLVMVMEDSSALWPVSIQTASIKESIAFFEKEMIFNELISLFFSK